MEPKDPDKFDIRFDDTPPESIDATETEHRRLDRLSVRVTLVALLIPSLVGLLLLFAYLDLKKKITQLDSTGTTEVKRVSQDLESTFSSLSVQVAKMEQEFSARLDSMERAMSSATRKLTAIENRIERLDKAKADRQALSSAVEKQEKAAASLQENLEASRSQWETIAKQLQGARQTAEESTRRVEDLNTAIKALETEVAAVSGVRPELKVLALSVKNEQETLAKKLDRTAGDLAARIKELEARLADLSRRLAPERAAPQAQPPSPPAQSAAPGSGKIVEQDINK